jgi:hypothetical protein
MPTIQFPRKGTGRLGAAPIAGARVIDVTVNLAADVTMGTATDDIVVADLPAGTVVLAAGIEQITAGSAGQGTLAPRVGTTAVGGTLASDAVRGTLTTATAANLPVVVPAAGATLNVLGATAARTTGAIRVFAVVLEGTMIPNTATAVVRDTSTL